MTLPKVVFCFQRFIAHVRSLEHSLHARAETNIWYPQKTGKSTHSRKGMESRRPPRPPDFNFQLSKLKMLLLGFLTDACLCISFWDLKAGRIWFCARHSRHHHGDSSRTWIIVFDHQVDTQIFGVPVFVGDNNAFPAILGRYGLALPHSMHHQSFYHLVAQVFFSGELVLRQRIQPRRRREKRRRYHLRRAIDCVCREGTQAIIHHGGDPGLRIIDMYADHLGRVITCGRHQRSHLVEDAAAAVPANLTDRLQLDGCASTLDIHSFHADLPVKGLLGIGVTKMSGPWATAEETAVMAHNRTVREISQRILPPATLVIETRLLR